MALPRLLVKGDLAMPTAASPSVSLPPAWYFDRLESLVQHLATALSFHRVATAVVSQGALCSGAVEVRLLLPADKGDALRLVAQTGGPVHARPDLAPEAAERLPGEAAFDETHGRACVPLSVRNRTIGALVFQFGEGRTFDEADRAFLQALARQCALAIERAQMHEMEAQARAEAEAEHERFRDLVQQLNLIFWEADPATLRFTFVSRRAQSILGYPVERWTDEPGFWASIIHPEDRDWAVGFCTKCTREGDDHTFEYRAIAQDGRTVWLRDIVYVVRDGEDRPVKLRGVMVDVTAEREARSGTPERVAHVFKHKPKGRSSIATLRTLVGL